MLAYLARYTHRVAISNRRLIAADAKSVTFTVKDYRIEGPGRYKTMTLATEEFIRRFLMHVLASAAEQAGALPLLAFYMTDLWRRMQSRGDGILRLADKSDIVDVARALAAEADRFLAAHPSDLDAVKRLFTLKLALVQEEGKPVRRRVPRNRLDANEARLVDALADARLVTTGEDAGGAFAEVAHEVLLQSWSTLASWLDAQRDFLIFKGRCERARVRWEAAQCDKSALLSGLDLLQAEQWLATRARDLDPDDATFIRESVAARDADLAAARLRRRVQQGTALAALAMSALGAFAGWEWQRADILATEAADVLVKLGQIYYKGAEAKDYTAAKESLEKAAQKGNVPAMAFMGVLYENGQGVPLDYTKAREWYEKAAAMGNALAMNNLGWLYAKGQGGPQDYTRAYELFVKAGAKGNAEAFTNLGMLYDEGRGVPLDYTKAREWYEKAAALGNALAMNNLGSLYAAGQGVPQDYTKAREWYEKAAAAKELEK